MNKDLISYALDITSFLIKNTELENIRAIILFGSTARGEATTKSDIDIFVELRQPNKTFQEKINKTKEKFFTTIKYKQYWALLGITNDINILPGTFDEWKELKNSIIRNGITLYGKYDAKPEGKNITIAYWDEIKPNSKRVQFNKKMFGQKQNKKFYQGILQKYNGKKIGKGAIIISTEANKELQELSKKLKTPIKTINAMEY